jgi:gliding motility-associated-like protein
MFVGKALFIYSAAFLLSFSPLLAQKVYVNTSDQILEITNIGSCQTTAIVTACDPGLNVFSMAVHKDTIYYTTGSGLLKRFVLGQPNSCVTLRNGLSQNSMTVDKNGLLYLASERLFRYNPHTDEWTDLGQMPFGSSGDLVFYRDKLLLAGYDFTNGTGTGIFEINIDDPAASKVFFNTPEAFFGLVSYPAPCKSNRFFGLVQSNSETLMVELDMVNKKQIGTICRMPLYIFDGGSTSEGGFDEGVTIMGLDITIPCFPAITGSLQVSAVCPIPGSITYRLDGGPPNTTGYFSQIATGIHKLTAYSPDGSCSSDTTFTITAVTNVIGNVQITKPDKCGNFGNGQIAITAASPNHPITYALLNNGFSQTTGVFDNLIAGVYNFRVTDAEGCSKDTSMVIVNNPSNIFVSDFAVTADICDFGQGEIRINLGMDETGVTSSINNGPFTSTLQYTGLKSGTYRVQVKKGTHCEETFTLTVPNKNAGCYELFVPTAFTPNGDGLNDIFRPVLPYTATSATLRIFNRWGQLLFLGKGNHVFWDGKYSGRRQASGVYIYTLEYTDHLGKRQLAKGTVTIVQ